MNRLTFKSDLAQLKPKAKTGEPLVENSSKAKRATMADFWIQNGWCKTMRGGAIKLTRADWQPGPTARKEAVRFLVEKVLKKDPRDVTQKDFWSNRLVGLLSNYYGNSPHKALTEAGYKMHPWEMIVTPKGYFDSKKNRIAAIRWLVKKLGKATKDITIEDFHSNRLVGLLNRYYDDSPYEALHEAKYRIRPWEKQKTPQDCFRHKTNRIASIRLLAKSLEKKPRDMTAKDFQSNHRGGLLSSHYGGSPYKAFHEAGLVTEKDEAYMSHKRRKRGDNE